MTGALMSLSLAALSAIGALIYFARRLAEETRARADADAARTLTQRAREQSEQKLRAVVDDYKRLVQDTAAEKSRLANALREAREMVIQKADADTVRAMLDKAMRGDK